MNIRESINALNDATNIIGAVSCEFRPGEPCVFVERQIRNIIRGPGDYGYEYEYLKGKKWVKAFAGENHFKETPRVSFYEGKCSSGIWYRSSDREMRVSQLKQIVRDYLIAEAEKLSLSLKSIS
jgi:hypothetical protein